MFTAEHDGTNLVYSEWVLIILCPKYWLNQNVRLIVGVFKANCAIYHSMQCFGILWSRAIQIDLPWIDFSPGFCGQVRGAGGGQWEDEPTRVLPGAALQACQRLLQHHAVWPAPAYHGAQTQPLGRRFVWQNPGENWVSLTAVILACCCLLFFYTDWSMKLLFQLLGSFSTHLPIQPVNKQLLCLSSLTSSLPFCVVWAGRFTFLPVRL